MPVSKAQQKATHKYIKNNYDRMELMLKKGEKSRIKAHAESRGESVNAFATRAINETIERDNGSISAPKGAEQEETGSSNE